MIKLYRIVVITAFAVCPSDLKFHERKKMKIIRRLGQFIHLCLVAAIALPIDKSGRERDLEDYD